VISETTLRGPYPGLRSFRRSETELFFGRDDCVNAMVDRLGETRFLAVLGSSGTGKSSLVKAGLLDALELGLMSHGGSRWSVVDFRPEDAPLRNLARQLLILENPDPEHSEADVELLRAFISRGPRSIIEWCRSGHLAEGENLLLLVDQFEELFRYSDYAGREEAEAFVALLIESTRAKTCPIYVAITMRSEYLGACALMDGLAEQINTGMYLTPRMTRAQCREAIIGPARVYGIEIKEQLVNRLLNELASFAPWDDSDPRGQDNTQLDRLVRRADQLPLLQYTLNRMWVSARERAPNKRVVLDLADFRGLSFALNEHADAIFNELDKQNLPVEKVFRALTAGSSIANAVREPTRFDRLVAICGSDDKSVRKIVNAYRAPDCNFLLPEIDPQRPLDSATVIDISHESLIRQWKRLSGWLAKETFAAQTWHRLIQLFEVGATLRGRALANLVAWRNETNPNAAWAQRYGGDYATVIDFLNESERADSRRRWIQIGSVSALFIVLLSAAVITFYQWQTAKNNLARAVAERQRAENNYSIAKDVFRSLTFDIAALLGSRTPEMQIMEVTDTHKKSQQKLEQLVHANANDNELVGIQAVMLDKFADAYLATGYPDLALDTAIEANILFRRLVELQPADPTGQRHLAHSLEKIGDLKLHLNSDAAAAGASYQEALQIFRELLKVEPGNEENPRQTAAEFVKLGDLNLGKNAAAARSSYEQALEIYRNLASRYPILGVYRRDISATLQKVAELNMKANDLQNALDLYQERLKVDRQTSDLFFDRKNSDFYDISIDLGKIADIQSVLGKTADARKNYEESLALDRRRGAGYDDIETQKRIGTTLSRIAVFQMAGDDIAGAQKSYQGAYEADLRRADLTRFAFRKDANETARDNLVNAYGSASWSANLAGKPQVAADYAETALKVDPAQTWIDINRAHAYLVLGRFDEAKAIYLAKKELKTDNAAKTFEGSIRDGFELLGRLSNVPDLARMRKELGL
jgi:tetratricopeptide (TPR) repeat protein